MSALPNSPREVIVRIAAVMMLVTACGDDATSVTGADATTSVGDSTTTESSPTGSITLSTITADGSSSGAVDSTSDTNESTSTSTTGDESSSGDSTTGDVVDDPGQTVSQFVGAGQRMSSPNFTMVVTVGQPTQPQSSHSSPNFRLQGGLVGANGAPP